MIAAADTQPACIAAIDHKRLATAKARMALWGGVLTVVEADDGRPEFVVTRWALTRSFAELGEVEAWLQRVGAPGA